MNMIEYLKGRAAALRRLAKTIDIRSIRDRVLALAEECVQLARLVEIPERDAKPDARPRLRRKASSRGRAPRDARR
jgi:hypothetical protein